MSSKMRIHPTAIVHPQAELHESVEVGPFCIVHEKVKIGAGCRLISHVVMGPYVKIEEENIFHPFSVIGGPPQDLSYNDEETWVEIGKKNIFRESTTVHRATTKQDRVTKIGNQNYFMAYVHVAHDCVVGNENILVNCANLAGHVILGNQIVIGGMSAITQHCRVGDNAFIAGQSILRKDLPPFLAVKEFSEVSGPNLIGLKRKGYSEEQIRVIREMYKIIYLGNLTTEKAMVEVKQNFLDHPIAQKFLEFVSQTKVGIQR